MVTMFNLYFRESTTKKINRLLNVGKGDILKTISQLMKEHKQIKIKIWRA